MNKWINFDNYSIDKSSFDKVFMRRARWNHVKVVEVFNFDFSVRICGGDFHVRAVDFIKLGVVNYADSSLLALFLKELVYIIFELGEFAVGVDDGESCSWAQLSDLLVPVPSLLGIEKVVSVDLVSEWELWNIEISVSVVVVSEPFGELVIENIPRWVVLGGVDRYIEIFVSLFKSLDQ